MVKYIPKLGATKFIELEDTPNSYVGQAGKDVRVKATEDGLVFLTHDWISGWNYRKKITISGSPGAGTNYQVLLKVGESAGATGAHFHVEGHSALFPSGQNDSGDLRFTDNDGITLLPFWVETVTGTSPNRVAYCWVKVAKDLSINRNIYCYYGNPNAENVSDITNIFIRIIDGAQPLKGSWHFDEGSGTTAYDTSGNNNHGTLYNGPTWVNGKFKYALRFDGVDDYVEVPHSASLNPIYQISIEGWFYWLGPTTQSAQNGIRKQNQYLLFYWDNNTYFVNTFAIRSAGTWYYINLGDIRYEIMNQWTHWVGTFDGKVLKLYINNVLRGSLTYTGTIDQTYNPLQIGREPYGWFYNGIIDEIRIYNRALTAEEISYLYNYHGYTTPNYPGKVLVKKYVSPEPAFSSAGPEETP